LLPASDRHVPNSTPTDPAGTYEKYAIIYFFQNFPSLRRKKIFRLTVVRSLSLTLARKIYRLKMDLRFTLTGEIYMDTGGTHTPESLEQLAKRVFTDLHQTIISHESGSLDGDVESVHDMRVTVRRLRVALSNFAVCVSKEDRKRLKSRLENLADALGEVRDMDVMIAAMKASLPNRSDLEKSAISTLIGRLRARRRSRLRALIIYLSGEEYADFKRESPSDLIRTAAAEPHSAPVDIQFKMAKASRLTEAREAPEVVEEERGQAA
jgi:hypothetical protein